MGDTLTKIVISAVDQTKAASDSVSKNLNQVEGAANTLNGVLGRLAPVLGAATFTAFLKGGIDTLDMLGDLQDRTGVAATTLAGFQLVAKQSDTSLEDLGKGLNKLSIFMAENGSEAAKLGVSAKDPAEAFIQLSKTLSSIEDPQQRAAVANKFLGKSFSELMPALMQGEDALRKQIEAGKAFADITPEMVKQAQDFNDQLDKLKTQAGFASVSFAGQLLPSMTDTIAEMQRMQTEGNSLLALMRGLAGVGKLPFDFFIDSKVVINSKTHINELTQTVSDLKRDLKDVSSGGLLQKALFGSKDEITQKLEIAQNQLEAWKKFGEQIDKRPNSKDASSSGKNSDITDFLNNGKKSANQTIQEQIALIHQENSLVAQGIPLEDAKTIAKLKQQGVTEQNIVQMLNLQGASKDLVELEKDRSKALKDIQSDIDDEIKARTEAYTTRMAQDKAYEETRAQYRAEAADRDKLGSDTVQKIQDELSTETEQLQFQLSIQNLSTQEQQKQIALRAATLDFDKAIYDLNQAGVYLDEQQTQELKDKYDALAKMQVQLKDNNVAAKDFGLIFKSSAEEAITNWKGVGNLIQSIAQDIEKMLIRKSVTQPMMNVIDGAMSKLDFGSIFGSLFTKNADGGTYSGAGISAYSGSVVSSPTLFPFAKGTGLMGEAGAEGIFPLKRGKDGKLGVSADGMGGGGVIVNIIGSSQQPQVQQSRDANGNISLDIIFDKIKSSLVKDLRTEGQFAQSLQSQYGLNRAARS